MSHKYNNPVLSILIVGTNEEQLIKLCLKAVLKNPPEDSFEILVIDNASTDQTLSSVRNKFPSVHIFHRDKQYGFASNNNYAISRSKGEYVLLLNPDTEVQPHALQILLNFMKRHPMVGVCGPQLRFPDGTLQYSCRRFPTLKSVLARRTPFRSIMKESQINKLHLMKDVNHSLAQPVDWLLGACLLIRRSTITTVGTLNENFFLYVDDIDYCYRTWQSGRCVYYVPKARVTHHHKAESDKRLFSVHSLHHVRSMCMFLIDHPEYIKSHFFSLCLRKKNISRSRNPIGNAPC